MRRLLGGLLAAGLLLLGACGSDDPNGPTPTPPPPPPPAITAARFTPGATTTLIPATEVGPLGATLTVPADSGPMSGAVIEIPAGALDETTTVSVSTDAGAMAVNEGTPGVAFHLNVGTAPGGHVNFAQPVRITVPYAGDGVPVPYYIDDAGAFHAVQLTTIDRVAKTMTFETFHASIFTWLVSLVRGDDAYQSPFVQTNDAFQVANRGSLYDSANGHNGECFGMTTFSLWYFRNAKPAEGNFYPRFMTTVGTGANGETRNGQQVIATRTFTSVAQQWSTYNRSLIGPRVNLTDEDNYTIIRNVLLNTRAPTVLYLGRSNAPGAHSVLATGFDKGDIKIYDVNFPTADRHIIYDTATKKFTPYNGAANANAPATLYDRIIDNGDGSFTTEPYRNILDDAKQNFQNSADATVTFTSHTSGATVSDRVVELRGRVDSSQVLVDRIRIVIGSTEFNAEVAQDGSFFIPVTLAAGPNPMQIITFGKRPNGNSIDAPNNLRVSGFLLNGEFAQSVILTTLTWDTDDTDIDTYVIDPSGDYSAYYKKTTADGGFLDYDVTDGFGPEHWLLTTANTVRYGQPYRFRAHYYSGDVPTNFTVAVQLYDGDRAITTYHRGTLVVSNPDNDRPDGTGADWLDVVTIIPVQESPTAPAGTTFARTLPSGRMEITVAVPPREQRRKQGGRAARH